MPISNDLNDLESQVKRSKISAASFLGKSSFASGQEIVNIHKTIGNLAGHVRKIVIRVGSLEKTISNQSRKITSLKNISALQGPQIRGTNIGAKLPGGSADNLNKTISTIAETVSSIAETLKAQKKTSGAASENERKKAEREKRGLVESKLEKAFGGIINVAQKIIAPVKSIIDRILDFIKTVILGRIIYKLVGWLGDPKNASKVKSIIRFVKDWWPTLLGAYIIFGTSFGRFTTKIIGMVARFTVQIAAKAIPGLITLARRNPATAALALGATTYLTNQALNSSNEQPTQQMAGGGYVRPRRFSGGGLASLRRFFGLDGGGYPGYVSGTKGVDKIPAMLSDGEFVMSRGAVQMYGADTLAAMNAAGGGTNRPKIMGGTTYAQGGGPMGRMPNQDPNYKDPVLDDRLNLLKSLEKYARSQVSSGGNNNLIKALNDVVLSLKGQRTSGSSGSRNPLSGLGIFGQNVLSEGQRFLGQAQDPRNYRGILNQGQQILKNVASMGSRISGGIKDKILKTADAPLAALEKFGTERENALIKSGELKPGDSLTKTTQKRLADRDAYVKSLYDPKKDKGPAGLFKKTFQDIQNRGLITDPFAALGLKEEGTEKFVEKLTGGKVKNLGAKITGLQYAAKGLLGPLGAGFKIDDRGSLARYVRPAMLEAQKRGQGGVGAVGLGQTNYNRLMGDRLANLALGQFSFKVDKSGRAKTDDVYDSNKSAEEYFKKSRSALKSGNIGGAFFQGLSGVLRINQNTGWGNLRPGGSGIDLGGGFTPTDAQGKPKTPQQIAAEQTKFAKPKPKTLPVKPPVRTTTVMQGQTAVTMYSKNDPRRKNTATPKTPSFSATTRGMRTKQETLGLMR
jgi:hypothetical protein